MHAFKGPDEGHGDETLEGLQEEEQFEDAGLTSSPSSPKKQNQS